MCGERKGGEVKRKKGSVLSIFMQADGVDMLLMVLGFIGAVCDGFTTPVLVFVMGKLMNSFGSASTDNPKNAVIMLYISGARWFVCFPRHIVGQEQGERQATRMRAKYLKAVLRQDVEYFDLHVTSTAEVITSVANDSLVIQDVISEKVNVATFIGSYVVGFLILWRLTIVIFPTVLLLVIPGMICGRAVDEFSKEDGRRVQQGWNNCRNRQSPSIRTVYSFVGETKTINEFSSALEGLVNLGVKQGLAKGWAIGSSNINYAIWSFIAYYGSRMVMYHGAQGGNVYAVGTAIALGGQALGTGLSNLKSISEALSAGERIMEVIKRIPKIDSYQHGRSNSGFRFRRS
ncbi:hypothetical protein Pint_19366 [Pistacia integerrima]|uniref:Uncharacterized protein n=1 Tax=Pistacia integerrima TaxID=434235 RepID=A0ACC0YXT2_9ROSI|nr:hypothetical protein Pint_19366 [Pistacia integerrima]